MSYKSLLDIQNECDLILPEEQVIAAVDKVATDITKDFKSLDPVFLIVMNGGLFFAADVLKCCDFRLSVDYIHASRYGDETVGSTLSWYARPTSDLTGRDVLVLDDILDGGITLAGITEYCHVQGANSVTSVIFANKDIERQDGGTEVADIIGTDIPDRYVFGYGMDYKGAWRQLRDVYAIPKDLE